jgi:signal transduction histidine kinase
MKHSFYIITISIIAVLTIVLCGQIYWLHRLYESIRQETYTSLTSAIETADFSEIAYRVKKHRNQVYKEIKSKYRHVKRQAMSFNYDFDIYAQSPYKLMRLVNGGIHKLLDPMMPINFKMFCYLFRQECQKKGIPIKINEVVFYNNKSKKAIHYYPTDKNVQNAGIVEYHNADGDYTYQVYVTPEMRTSIVNVNATNYSYNLYLNSLTDICLQRMWGIILTTILIIVLLAFAFWYLIRTIISLRSIEEMKDDFTNNMTHELKTPIAVTYSAVDAMLNFKQGDDKMKREQYLGICEEQLKRLSGLVEKILSMSMERRKTLSMNREDVALLPMIESMSKEFQLKNDKRITFSIDISPTDMTIHADPMHISNAISNIIDNSIKYSGNDVEIRIKAYHRDDKDIIVMSDNGIGISQENQKRIFDKFFRVGHGNRYDVRGYGLGLYYVRQIIERHNGSIAVESSVGKGTTFTITLPAK